MIHDLALRWFVTILFVLAAAECLYALAVGNRRPATVVSQLLHVVMAVAMAVMAWPWGAALPTVAPMVFFLFATGWFVAVTASPLGAGHRIAGGYHALMMLAMAWMYAVMNGRLLPGQASYAADITSSHVGGIGPCRARRDEHAGHGHVRDGRADDRRLRRRIPGLHRHAELGVHHRFCGRHGVLALPVPEPADGPHRPTPDSRWAPCVSR